MDKGKGIRRGFEKMTVVDTLQAAYSKQDIPEEERQYIYQYFNGVVDLTNISKNDVEKFFSILREITDKVALMNSPYPSDLPLAFMRLKEFWSGLQNLNLDLLQNEIRLLFISHLTFHRETIADIIAEARELLMEDRRNYLKDLVNYHRDFINWLKQIEKKYL